MTAIIAWGILLAWVRSQGSLGYALQVAASSVIGWGFSFFTAFAVVWKFGPSLRGIGGRRAASVLLAIMSAATLYLIWAHRRTLDFIMGLDHGVPYPDPWIRRLERWFDARHPVTPGSLKMHGEFYRVAFVLGMLILIFAGATGFLLGLLWNRPGAAGEGRRGRSDRQAT